MDVVDLIMVSAAYNPYSIRQAVAYGFKVIRTMDWPFGGLKPGHSISWTNLMLSP